MTSAVEQLELMDKLTGSERERDEERESRIITNYGVKNLSVPWKLSFVTIQQFNGLVRVKTKGKKNVQITTAN